MSKSQRDKGARREREMVLAHKAAGIHAERVPLSGGAFYKQQGHDIDVYARGKNAAPYVCEVKARGSGGGFTTIQKWLGENDALFLIADNCAPLVVLPMQRWLELARQQNRIA